MCDRSSILVIFLILKVLILVVIPITLFLLYKRENKYFKMVGLIEIVLLILLIVLRIFNNNCVINSNINGIKLNNLKNNEDVIIEYDNLLDDSNIQPDTNYKTYQNKNLYYFNQNSISIKDSYYICNGKKVYMNSFGSGLTAFSIAISTLYNSNINPITLLNNYKENNDICENKMTVYSLFSNIKKSYSSLEMQEIDRSQVESNIKNGRLVIAELSGNSSSNLTCDSGYIVIYNINLEGKYMIADPSLLSKDFVCPYSSKAYGRVIKSDNMDKSWNLNDLNNETLHYYSLYTIGSSSNPEVEMGHD